MLPDIMNATMLFAGRRRGLGWSVGGRSVNATDVCAWSSMRPHIVVAVAVVVVSTNAEAPQHTLTQT